MYKFYTFLFLVYIAAAFSQDYEVIENAAKTPILSPSFKDRETLKIKLNNELEAVLVSDPNEDQSSAVLIVKTGSWEDPPAYPGIAHFLEHMLFLGTKKYPDESEFSSFVAEHGGLTNAFTDSDFTAFVFSINNDAFPDGLDRFAQFFIEPLFNPSGTARELQAIDQEFAMLSENDNVREMYVLKELSNPGHPFHAFNIGNKESLAKVSQETLKQWYREHYSANRMRLVVHSSLPLDELVKLVVEDFKMVPNQHLPKMHVNAEKFLDDVKGHMVYIDPITHMRKLTLLWDLPSRFGDMQETKPELLACSLLNHQGKGSLLNELKREKLAEEINCNGRKIDSGDFEFAIEITLTDAGVKDVDKVILRCFQAIANFKKRGVPQHLFNELHLITMTSYQYQERENTFENILREADWIAGEDLDTYPERTLIIQRFDPKAAHEFLSYLTPETAIYSLMAPATLTKVAFDHNEQWFGVPYTVRPIPRETMIGWHLAAAGPNFDLPPLNPFLPEKLNLIPRKNLKMPLELIPRPQVLVDNEAAKVYFAKDARYLVPKISWIFDIKTPAIDLMDPESVVLGDLFVRYITDQLSDYTFSASMAGLEFSVERNNNGLTIVIEGYSDKAGRLCLEIVKALKNLQTSEQKFKLFKTSLLRQYQNSALENPYAQAYDMLKSIVYKEYITDKSKLAALRKVTFDRFDQFAGSFLDYTFIEAMLYGNMVKQEARELVQQIISTFDSKPYPKQDQSKESVIVLPAASGPYYVETKTKSQGNVAILSIESLPFSFQARAAQQVLMQAIKDPFFNELRTKQQTGYLVASKADEFELHLFNTFLVQSTSHEGRDLLARFELFIESFLQDIENLIPERKFETLKEAQLKALQQPPKNILEMGHLLNRLAFKFEGDFHWVDKRIKGLQDLTYQEFIALARKGMGKQNKRRLGIILQGSVSPNTTMQYQKLCNIAQLRKLASYEFATVP